jgi:hypothetical protein
MDALLAPTRLDEFYSDSKFKFIDAGLCPVSMNNPAPKIRSPKPKLQIFSKMTYANCQFVPKVALWVNRISFLFVNQQQTMDYREKFNSVSMAT